MMGARFVTVEVGVYRYAREGDKMIHMVMGFELDTSLLTHV